MNYKQITVAGGGVLGSQIAIGEGFYTYPNPSFLDPDFLKSN
ncbi:hypothetical protein JOD24_001668 [Kroppenstedtia sanguinis]|uniref:Uncharacterized protein n=1 Tax=Kroppenstedtia sanguinis TaxID=1380684 RepID=A0ABW4CCU7_9BACL